MSRARRWRSTAPIPLSLAFLALALLALPLGGCSDSTGPEGGGDSRGQQGFLGELDPGAGAFVLQKIDPPDPGARGSVELAGSALVIDQAAETVEITVALRNASDQPLHGPATVWLSNLSPAMVAVLNPDLVRNDGPPDGAFPPLPVAWGFQYEGLFGEDGILSPGETSGGKPWRFHVPGLTSFSFAARLDFGLQPGLPLLGGQIWNDLNGNGLREPEEPPLPAGYVEVLPPEGGLLVAAHPDPRGRWAIPVEVPGLYRVTYFPPPTMGPIPPLVTTPNPLEVLLTPGAPGEPPRSYLEADFGVLLNGPPPQDAPPIILTDTPADSLHMAAFSLQAHEVFGHILRLRVGYSGCQPEHPFALFMTGGFAESNPVQVRLVLQHDDLGELCDAWFTAELAFDLSPLIRLYLQQYGGEGPIAAHLLGPDGEVATFLIPVMIR